MAEVYILYSKSLDKYYIGSCKSFSERLSQHLNGQFSSSFTKSASDWIVFFLISSLSYLQARKIEAHIKSMKSRKYITNLKIYPEISQKLISRFEEGKRDE
ncbi:MAG: GIY-YIG nuclease family protein [Chitinophagaceae bacterium]|nr:GIY-YIG nuclease family protein [Chitinophagaceae bacterium]